MFQETGELDDGVWSAGTVMGLIDSVVTCEELCQSIISEAESIIQDRLANSVVAVSNALMCILKYYECKCPERNSAF